MKHLLQFIKAYSIWRRCDCAYIISSAQRYRYCINASQTVIYYRDILFTADKTILQRHYPSLSVLRFFSGYCSVSCCNEFRATDNSKDRQTYFITQILVCMSTSFVLSQVSSSRFKKESKSTPEMFTLGACVYLHALFF